MTRLAKKLSPWSSVAVACIVALLGAGTHAVFTAADVNSGNSVSTASLSGATISMPSTSSGSNTVTWTQQASVSDGTKNSQITYSVLRKGPSDSSFVAVPGASGCAGNLPRPTSNCTDVVSTSGSYSYRVVAKYGGFSANSNDATVSATVGTPPSAPTTVALANGGGVGNAYINDANKASLSVNVGLSASSSASNTVHVTITDGTNTTTDQTAPATAGSGTVQVTGINATSLTDGSVTISATSSNSSGTSAPTTTAVTKDVVKPTSSANAVTNITSGNSFTVPYAAADAAVSSTLSKVELYVDPPGASGFPVTASAADSDPHASGDSIVYNGATTDGTYGFYTLAYDKAGNVEASKTTAEQSATRNTTPPTVTGAVIAKTDAIPNSTAGFIRAFTGTANQAGYRIYANATAGANPISTVAANTSNVPGGAASVSLSACSADCTVNGVTYGYVSAAQTANTGLLASPGVTDRGFSITATDTASQSHTFGNPAATTPLKVTIDNTIPQIVSIATADVGGGTASPGLPSQGDKVTFAYSEAIDGISLLGGWNWPWTATANVQVVITNPTSGSDTLTVKSADGSSTLPFGTVSLGDAGYVTGTGDAVFGATGTASTISRSGNNIVITLGTKSGTGVPGSVNGNKSKVLWTPGSSNAAYDAAGNKLGTNPTNFETGNNTQF